MKFFYSVIELNKLRLTAAKSVLQKDNADNTVGLSLLWLTKGSPSSECKRGTDIR